MLTNMKWLWCSGLISNIFLRVFISSVGYLSFLRAISISLWLSKQHWINTAFFPLSILDWPFISLFFFPLWQIKNLSLPKGKTLKTLNCILFQTILDWCVMLCHITLANSCLLACAHQWTSENEGLNWTRNIRMQCDSSWTSFFDVLQQMLPMNTNMKTFRSCLQTKLDTSKFKYKMI